MTLIDLVGWVGTLGVLIAYVSITRRGVTMRAQVINAVAAVCLVVNTVAHHAVPVVALNAAWLVIAIVGMVKLGKVGG